MRDRDNGGSSATKIVLLVLGVVGGILLLLVVACGGLGYLMYYRVNQTFTSIQQMVQDQEQSELAAKRFLDDIAVGQIDTAYASTSQGFKKQQTAADFRQFIDKHPLLKKNTTRDLIPQNSTPTMCLFDATLIAADDKELDCTITVVKEDQRWKVDRITVP